MNNEYNVYHISIPQTNCNYLQKQTASLVKVVSLIIGKFNLKLKPTPHKAAVEWKFAINMLYVYVYGRDEQPFANIDDL